MLDHYRVLDLTDARGQLAGHLLASLGAEVILVEPAGGSDARKAGPFMVENEPADSGIHWLSYNRGKRSVELDLGEDADREVLLRLAAGADVLIETDGQQTLAARGLAYADLAALNPALVYVSISPFGSDGPKADWATSDLVIAAASGQMAMTGDDDRAPLRMSLPQVWYHPCVEAVGAALIALHERQNHSGLGQHVDCSAQTSMLQASQSWMLCEPVGSSHGSRVSGGMKVGPIPAPDGRKLGPFHIQLTWPCKDGHVSVTFLFGVAIAQFTQNLMNWVCEEGFCDEATRDKDWVNYAVSLFTGQEPHEEYKRVKQCLADFFNTKTKAELFDASFERRVLIAPVTTTQEVLDLDQFEQRGVWEVVDGVRYPGRIAIFGASPAPPLTRTPRLGEHTAAIRALEPRLPALAPLVDPKSSHQPLEDVKILDLMWVMAGPAATRVLADYGAQVVRIESDTHMDGARTLQPYVNNSNHPDESALFHNLNANKLGMTLDLSNVAGRDIVLDLVRWADVVMESFAHGRMKQWGLSYDDLRAVNPNIIMASTCLMGQSGPLSPLAGFGTMAAAISGFFNITGWPDRAPSGPFGAYTDYISPRFLVAAVMSALEHRRRTGQGQYIDMSQAEASLHQLTPALLETQRVGQPYPRRGNDDERFAPHGVFRCEGTDCWVAVAITNNEEWRAFCQLLGREDLAALAEHERWERRRELDEIVTDWTMSRGADDAMSELQRSRIPGHRVQNTKECFEDPQLHHRDYWKQVEHGSLGTTWVEGTRFRLSRTPADIRRAGPTLGEHNWQVLSEILGYDDDRIADLVAEGVLG